MRLSSAIDLYISSSCAGRKNSTAETYRRKLAVLLRGLGDVPLSSVRLDALDALRVSLLSNDLSVWYVRGVLRTWRGLFRWLVRSGRLWRDPSVGLILPAVPPPDPKPIESAIFARLLLAARAESSAFDSARNLALLVLLRDTGARVGALLAADVGHVDLGSRVIESWSKGRRVRLYFHHPARRALERWLCVRDAVAVDRALFVSIRGTRFTRSGVYNMLGRLSLAAGLAPEDRVNPHSFRHAFARDMLLAGADLSEVSQLMGHSSIRVTADYYARWLPDELARVHDKYSPGRFLDV